MHKPKHTTGTILLAGASGYLGNYITRELINQNIPAKIIVRQLNKLSTINSPLIRKIKAEVTQPETLRGICEGVSTLISCIGITRQKDGLTYMDVDYQANINLLHEAQRAGVKKFIFVAALNGQYHRQLKIMAAKERFVDALKVSGMDYCIIRPNGFFSDMADFLSMAKKGKVYLFGDGNHKLNPIHGADLAKICLNAINSECQEIEAGGPDVLSQNEIAEMALKACSKPLQIVHLPDWIRRITIKLLRTFTSPKTYGPPEFFLTFMGQNNVADQYGHRHLIDFFYEIK